MWITLLLKSGYPLASGGHWRLPDTSGYDSNSYRSERRAAENLEHKKQQESSNRNDIVNKTLKVRVKSRPNKLTKLLFEAYMSERMLPRKWQRQILLPEAGPSSSYTPICLLDTRKSVESANFQ